MRIALIGRGKTGGALLPLIGDRHQVDIFSSTNPVTLAALKACDVAIVFVPPAGLKDIYPILLESGVPVISGTTGFDYEKLPKPQAPWIYASNFSLGMNAVFLMTRAMAKLSESAGEGTFSIKDVHHISKVDAPSGTALRLKQLLPGDTTVASERVGDVRGLHTVELCLAGETLRLEHEAKDRSVFAKGALYAVEELLPPLQPGLFAFEELLEKKLRKDLFHV